MALPPLLTGAVKVTVACAFPAVATPIVGASGRVPKLILIFLFAFMLTVQADPTSVSHPVHELKLEPTPAAGVKVTDGTVIEE